MNRKWFPNCGPQLIKKEIPVFKYFGDLSPQQVFDLFLHFVNSPDYSTSLFKSLANDSHRYLSDNLTDNEVIEGEDKIDIDVDIGDDPNDELIFE